MQSHLERPRGIAKRLLVPTPRHLVDRQIRVDEDGLAVISRAIRDRCPLTLPADASCAEGRERDLASHLLGRLNIARAGVIPWLDSISSLRGTRVLEVGCGTGSSTVALAEQGAIVTAVDTDEASLAVARTRSDVYGLAPFFREMNATEILAVFGENAFELVIFYASLEHMTIAERLSSLRSAWASMIDGGLLAVVETPNRLWYHDGHTSDLPFFHWLPEEIAFRYSQYSAREGYRELYRDYSSTDEREGFARRGRGASFHEFQLAIGPEAGLNVVSSWSSYRGVWYDFKQSRLDRRYKALLKRIYPTLHEGFLDHDLFLTIRKTGTCPLGDCQHPVDANAL